MWWERSAGRGWDGDGDGDGGGGGDGSGDGDVALELVWCKLEMPMPSRSSNRLIVDCWLSACLHTIFSKPTVENQRQNMHMHIYI